jgi:predicted phage-related endonuclease
MTGRHAEGMVAAKEVSQMIIRPVIALFATSLTALSPALAETPASEKPALDPNERICRTESVTGSRLQKVRTCRTRKEWQESRRETGEAMGGIQRSQGGTCGMRPC